MCHLKEQPITITPTSSPESHLGSFSPATKALSLFTQKRKRSQLLNTPPLKVQKSISPSILRISTSQNSKKVVLFAKSGKLDSLKKLLEGEKEDELIDVNYAEPLLGNTALHYAVYHNHINILCYLLSLSDIDVNLTNNLGKSPLLSAIEYGNTAMVKIFVKAGSILTIPDSQGFTCLHKAVLSGNREILRFLLSRKDAPIDQTSYEQKLTPLHQASFHGKSSFVKMLINNNSSVNARSSNGTTPLHMACLKNHSKVVSILLEKGSQPDIQDVQMRTPLHYACMYGHLDSVLALSVTKCSLDLKDFKEQTPLLIASQVGFEELLETLLSNFTPKSISSK